MMGTAITSGDADGPANPESAHHKKPETAGSVPERADELAAALSP